MKKNLLLPLGLVATATMAFAQGPPQIVWEMDAEATNLTFSAGGETMYTGGLLSLPNSSNGNIRKWDVPSRTELYILTSGGSGAIGVTNALAATPDGTAFASGHGSTQCPPQGACVNVGTGFHVWDAASGTEQFALGDVDIDGLVESVAFSPDGEFVAFGMSRSNLEQIRVYNYPEYTLQGAYDGHGTTTYCTAFSPTENLLATGGSDGNVKLWDVETNQLVRTLAHGSYTNGGDPISVAFSPDGSQLAVSGRGYALNATVWNVSTGALAYSLPCGAGAFGTSAATVAFSPNGRYLVAGTMRYISPAWGGLIRIWDMADGSLAREYTEETLGPVGSPMVVAVSPGADSWIAYTHGYQVKFAETDLTLGDGPGVGYCFGDLGSGTPCPCGNDNDGSVAGSGCANGVFTSGAHLTGTGVPSLSADSLVLATTGLEPSNSGLYFQANNDLSPGIVWGDGLQCAGGSLKRLGVRFANSTGFSDTSGLPQPISVQAGNILAGDTKYYQCWYRNPNGSPCATDFNTSNGYAVTWAP